MIYSLNTIVWLSSRFMRFLLFTNILSVFFGYLKGRSGLQIYRVLSLDI